jgi:[ribosomal protein S5]-alanine N-acetyltransferase
VSVFDWDRYHRRALIGYELARDQWGKGLAQEALHEVLRFAFDKMMLNRIEIWTAAENQRSVRLSPAPWFQARWDATEANPRG